MVQKTSIQTYHSIKNSGILSDKRMKVYEIFYEHPEGLTGTQVSNIFKQLHPTAQHSETIRNRITELRDMGVLSEVGMVECEFTNRQVMKFMLNDNMPVALTKKKSLNERIDDVLESITIFSSQLTSEQKVHLRNIYKQVNSLKK